jgi:hypothetical protein
MPEAEIATLRRRRHYIKAGAGRQSEDQWPVGFIMGTTIGTNAHCWCPHSRPRRPDIPPGEQRTVTGEVYFLRGGPDELLARWNGDFEK